MADMPITIIIPDANVVRVRAAFLEKYPKPATGYTDIQWFKEIIRRFLRNIVQEYEEKNATDAASVEASILVNTAKASVIVPDNIIQ